MSIRRRKGRRLTRDFVLAVLGVLGLAHETLVQEHERPTLLFAFLAMIGLPVMLRGDEKAQEKTDAQPPARADAPPDRGDEESV